jgi:hypothetical protein
MSEENVEEVGCEDHDLNILLQQLEIAGVKPDQSINIEMVFAELFAILQAVETAGGVVSSFLENHRDLLTPEELTNEEGVVTQLSYIFHKIMDLLRAEVSEELMK